MEAAKQRKLRTRGLILMGTYLEHWINQDEATKERLMKELDQFLTRRRDRELSDLPPLPSK